MRHTPRDQAWMPTDLGPKRHGRASFWLAIGRPPGGPPRWKVPCAAAILLHNASPGWLGSVARRFSCLILRLRASCVFLVKETPTFWLYRWVQMLRYNLSAMVPLNSSS